jgi:hypothetical protein
MNCWISSEKAIHPRKNWLADFKKQNTAQLPDIEADTHKSVSAKDR